MTRACMVSRPPGSRVAVWPGPINMVYTEPELLRESVELARELGAGWHTHFCAPEVDPQIFVDSHGVRPAVWLDTTRISEADAEVSLPYMLRRYRAGGIDPLREPILTYPVLHYQNGGLVIDEHGETTVEGLFACGEIAGGTHGRNRMMGNSLLECCVFGRRAGKRAAEVAA